MKLFSLSFVAAAAVAPPRIELQLDESLKLRRTNAMTATTRFQPNGDRVMSRKDYTVLCQAGDNAVKCPLPKAQAFDSIDKQVPIRRSIFLVDQDGKTMNKKVAKVDRSKRSTYVYKFDAKDAAGNHAEQVVIAVEFGDATKPIIRHNGCRSRIVEAKTKYSMCSRVSAWDNIDKSVNSRIRYTITRDNNAQLVKGVTLAAAKKAMSSNKIGKYTIRAAVTDKAGAYGKDGKNNRNSYTWTVTVRDTTRPVIAITGASPHTTECAKKYKDFGAKATDTYDGKVKVTTNNGVLTDKIGRYSVHYTAQDAAGNKAFRKTRTVIVSDTTAPKVTLKGAKVIEVNAGTKAPRDAGARCNDACDGKLIPRGKWVNRINMRKPNNYVYRYTCKDKTSGKPATVDRTYTVVDRTAPTIKLIGKDTITLEASTTKTYNDQGASCHDYVDGKINSVYTRFAKPGKVNYGVPGTYKYFYDCKDAAGNKATPLMRTIVVRDTTKPVISVTGRKVVSIEAGFPYADMGATAKDSLDGDITKSIKTVNSVDTSQAFLAKRSCAEIKSADAKAKSGNYYITTSTFKRVWVFCDMATGQTWNKCSNCKKTIPSKGGDASCASRGLKIARKVSYAAKKQFGATYATVNENTNTYLCTVGKANFDISNKVNHDKIAHAETGKYVVSYNVKDKAGNAAVTKKRTVIVADTLPPVIALKLNGKLIHTSGTKNRRNKAYDAKVNPFLAAGLMEEESTSVNGWVIGAVGAAVAGVALLGMSTKSTVTSVPV